MTSAPERHMIRLDRKPQLFSMRVAALILQNGHLLVQRGTRDNYWALPGGRAEIGESSQETIIREIGEELDRDCSVERLLWSAENFSPMTIMRRMSWDFIISFHFASLCRSMKAISCIGCWMASRWSSAGCPRGRPRF